MNIKPRHGANITVRAEKSVQFIGWCSGNDTWSIKDVRANIVYDDVRHARCQKVNIYKSDDAGTTIVRYDQHTGPFEFGKEVVDHFNGLRGIFDLFGVLARRC
uniref:WH1 domain-containing protein n=1 Tax=Panagrellus redivivus TaxID=6233 RepID=A0A7E4VY17_PANRE